MQNVCSRRWLSVFAPLVFLFALCCGVGCDHDAPDPDPVCPEPEQWHTAPAGRYAGRVRYSCDCGDEVQIVLTASPSVSDTLRVPSVRRTVYVDKRDLPNANFTMGRTVEFSMSNYHALDLHHDDSLEFVCRVQPLMP